jgi:hypothetical protein
LLSGFPIITLKALLSSPYVAHALCILFWFQHANNFGWEVQIMQLLIMQSPAVPCYLVLLRPK